MTEKTQFPGFIVHVFPGSVETLVTTGGGSKSPFDSTLP